MGLQRPFFSSNLHHICRLRFTKRVLSCSRRAPFFDSLGADLPGSALFRKKVLFLNRKIKGEYRWRDNSINKGGELERWNPTLPVLSEPLRKGFPGRAAYYAC